jgi:hypothetical protein
VVDATSLPLCPGKETRYPLYRKLGEPQSLSGRVRKISPPPEFDSRTVQPVAIGYNDWAIPAYCVPPWPSQIITEAERTIEDQMVCNCMIHFKSWISCGVATKNYAKTVNRTKYLCFQFSGGSSPMCVFNNIKLKYRQVVKYTTNFIRCKGVFMYFISATCFRHYKFRRGNFYVFPLYFIRFFSVWWWPTVMVKHVALIKYINAQLRWLSLYNLFFLPNVLAGGQNTLACRWMDPIY